MVVFGLESHTDKMNAFAPRVMISTADSGCSGIQWILERPRVWVWRRIRRGAARVLLRRTARVLA